MSSGALHEGEKHLTRETLEMHRALASLMEELEAVDWYGQRIDATGDDELRAVLDHNRREEKEHACMTLEWIRRRDPEFDRDLRRFLFRDEPLGRAEPGENDPAEPTAEGSEGLGIGSLRAAEVQS